MDYLRGGEGRSQAKHAVEVNDVLRGRRRGVLRVKRSRSMVCSGARGGGTLWVKWLRSRAKQSSVVEGEAVEATACSGGEAVEGVLRRRRRAPRVGGVKDLKHVSGKIFLIVERAARAPDIYIGGQMRDARSLRCVAHFFRCRTLFLDERHPFSETRHPFT
jgi:hypothetical protein